MTAFDLYKAGKLADALHAQLQAVKDNPGDPNRRVFLFELSTFAGDLDRARRQIEAVKYDEPERDAAVATYGQLIGAEEKRRRLFSDGLAPQFLADPPEHVTLRLDAVQRLRDKKLAEASELVARANSLAPTLRGELNSKTFEGLRDADDLFAGVLEVMALGNYFWVPLELVEAMVMKPPEFPRDLLWFPAHLETAESAGDVFVPVLYPNSHLAGADDIKLGRANDWQAVEGGMMRGIGARTFLVGDDGMNLLEWRQLQMGRD